MDAGIDEKVDQLRREGWCVLERIIPADAIDRVRAHVREAHETARQDYEAMGGNIGRQTGPNGEPGVSLIAYLPEFAPYLGDERLLGVARAIFGEHVRIAQTEFKTQVPNRTDLDWRGFHSDWPHDLTDRDLAGRVAQPFPDATMQLSVLWMLSPFGPATGGTWVVPRSHRDPLNPRMHQTPEGLQERIDQFKPIRGEVQVGKNRKSIWCFSLLISCATSAISDHYAAMIRQNIAIVKRMIFSGWWCDFCFPQENLYRLFLWY